MGRQFGSMPPPNMQQFASGGGLGGPIPGVASAPMGPPAGKPRIPPMPADMGSAGGNMLGSMGGGMGGPVSSMPTSVDQASGGMLRPEARPMPADMGSAGGNMPPPPDMQQAIQRMSMMAPQVRRMQGGKPMRPPTPRDSSIGGMRAFPNNQTVR